MFKDGESAAAKEFVTGQEISQENCGVFQKTTDTNLCKKPTKKIIQLIL